MHGNDVSLGELVALEHLPLVDSDGTPGGGTVIIDIQSPLAGGDGGIQQHIRKTPKTNAFVVPLLTSYSKSQPVKMIYRGKYCKEA